KSEALSYARGGCSPKTVGEVVHTELEGPFNPDVTGMKYFQVFVDEASREKRVIGLRTKDAATMATAAYIDEMVREGVVVRCISGDGAGEFGRRVRFQRMLTERSVKWRKTPPRTPQSNEIAERATKHVMQAARSQLIHAGLGEEFCFFAVADATYKTTGMPHKYLRGETPCECLTNKPFNYERLRVFGTECFVHQTKQQRGTNVKFHPYAKRGILVGHDTASLCWHVWIPKEGKLLVGEPELDILGESELDEDMDTRDEEEDSTTGSDLPQRRKVVKTRFVFKIKHSAEGRVERYKARLVARWSIDALDFTQVYLNADLQEDVWLELPDGRTVKAKKAIYGLKQSAMEWYHELRGTILAEGWTSSQHDECLYFKKSEDGHIAILTTYVDDTVFTTGDLPRRSRG
ncbi:unnamed protein product, partial [Choristocarpus tenellus]